MSMRPIESMEVLQRLVNGGAVDTERLVEAAKTALCALDELVKEDQKRLTEDKTCGSCQYWERDYSSKAGGWCPFPVRRSTRNNKYIRQSAKACLKYKQQRLL